MVGRSFLTCGGVSLVRATKVFEAYNYSRFFPTPENCEKVVSELQSEFVEIVAEELQQRFEAGARIDLLNGFNTQTKRKFKADANRVYLTCKNVIAELEDKTVKRETYFFRSFSEEEERELLRAKKEVELGTALLFLSAHWPGVDTDPQVLDYCKLIPKLSEFQSVTFRFLRKLYDDNNVPDLLRDVFGDKLRKDPFKRFTIKLAIACRQIVA